MTQTSFDVVGIGNAIVDVLAHADDALLEAQGVVKGGMTLIDAPRAVSLYEAMGPAIEASGGSAANTIAGIASLGGKAGFIGRVRNDELGSVFAHDIRALGVQFTTPAAADGPPTARCLIMVTPEGQRSMSTYLGACQGLGPEDVDPALIRAAGIIYLEGYLWDPPLAKEAFRKAMVIAKEAGRKTALTLSDSFCVARYRAEFRALIDEKHIDILFANEHEIMSLYEVDTFDDALQIARGRVPVAAQTRSEKGSVVMRGDELHVVDPEPVARVVDSTGAGDLYASGFLFGLARGRDLKTCGQIASLCAAEAISQLGPRPSASLAELIARRGL
jgi:sugar/nucleoside kinase (ribokinase family)